MPLARRYIPHYTVQDYMRWEGDWELIEGTPVAMSPSAGYTHQKTCSLIHWQLMDKLTDCEKCLALYEIDWIVSEDTVVRPDIIVICEEPEGEYITKAPEVIFEVISKETAHKDEKVKYEIYEKEGVKYYVLVYPELKVAKIFRLDSHRYVKVCDAVKDSVEFSIKDCTFNFDFSTIWP